MKTAGVGPGPGVGIRFHVCPVCRREIEERGTWRRVFSRHNTTIGDWCPMSGRDIPEPEAVW